MPWIEEFIIEEEGKFARRNPLYSTESAKIVEQIDEIVRSLAARYGVRVEKDEKLSYMMGYSPRRDSIRYNPDSIRTIYEKLSEHHSIKLADLVEHVFGHELGHRKKHKKFAGYKQELARKIDVSLTFLCDRPEEAIQLLERYMPELMDFHPRYRACAIAYVLFEEYYAVKENPLRKPSIERVENIVITNNIKRNLREAIRALRTLSQASRKELKYFIIPLVYLSTSALKIFPYSQYYALRKIKTFLQQKIITAQDVFDLNKIAQVADIILSKLEGISETLPEDIRVEILKKDLESVIPVLYSHLLVGWSLRPSEREGQLSIISH